MTALLQEAFAKASALPPAEQEVLAAHLLAELNKLLIGSGTALSRGAASLEPMDLSGEDAALMQESWEKGLARPTISIAMLPEYDG